MTNKEKAIEIFRLLEKNHINLYHDISKEDFEIELNKFLEIADDLDSVHFDAGISKLFSLFKDAHTNYIVKGPYVDVNIKYIEGKFYLCKPEEKLCEEIKKVNGVDFDEVYNRFKGIIQYEYDSWANKTIASKLGHLYRLKMIDCENKENPNQVEFVLESGKKVVCEKRQKKIMKKPNYSFSMSDNILIINYSKCIEMEDYPFKKFVRDVKDSFNEFTDCCLVDLRGNTGGSGELIRPLIDLLEEKNVKTYVLMNEAVYSSGTFALFDLKKYLNATFIGTEAGQGGCRYGQQIELEVDGCRFGYPEKKFDLVKMLGNKFNKNFSYEYAIRPDIYLAERVEDVKLGIDGQLRDCLEIMRKEINLAKNT